MKHRKLALGTLVVVLVVLATNNEGNDYAAR